MKRLSVLAALAVLGCSSEPADTSSADAGPAGPPPTSFTLLSETGLYSDLAAGTLGPGVHEYTPKYALWSDGAEKQRWIMIPEGQQIDTSNMNFWRFPNGTKLWKEFVRDDVRVETRLLMKNGPGDWFMMAFKWDAELTEATAVPEGEADASGTPHDIPKTEDCVTCHSGMSDNVLGFGAVQLSHDLPGVDLTQAIDLRWLSAPPEAEFVTPGDTVEEPALGYLHANCGNCHNPRSKVYSTAVQVDTWLQTDKLTSVETTPTYLTLVDQDTTGDISAVAKRITPGDPENSAVYELMALRGDEGQMPVVGTEIPDPTGLAAIEDWIHQLGQ